MERRKFIKSSALGAGAITLSATSALAATRKNKVRIGFIGVGGRGRGLLNEILSLDWIDIPAICDINPGALVSTQEIIQKHGRKKASEYVGGEHGGVDLIQLGYFAEAVRYKKQSPVDVYDSLLMSCVVALSGNSIAKGSQPVEVPDFTRGKWKTRKPTFAI